MIAKYVWLRGFVLLLTPPSLLPLDSLIEKDSWRACKFNEAPQKRDLGVVWQITCLLAQGH